MFFRYTFFIICYSSILMAQEGSQLPLFNINDLIYQGAFRLPADEFGVSSMNYAQGPIAYNPLHHSLFVVGHSHQQAIAEFHIPMVVNSDQISELMMASTPKQAFTEVLDRTTQGNPEAMDRIGGMSLIQFDQEQKLIVNTYEYYDAPADNNHTTLIIHNPDDLEQSNVDGYYEYEGGAGHTSGWISSIPVEWQTILEGTHLTGQSSGQPIISRFSVGPSAFSFNSTDMINVSGILPTTKLLDYSLANPLHLDLENATLKNDLWTHLSRATYGFIIPGTRTYMTLGYSGGHRSGVCYKCEQDNGIECGGYCPPDTADLSQYYWLWDMQDLIDVKHGLIDAHQPLPYDYGPLMTPFQNDFQEIGGASFDPSSGSLYMTIQRADTEQGTYANPPIVVVYNFDVVASVDVELSQDNLTLYPNPTEDIFEIKGLLEYYSIQILDATGTVFQNINPLPKETEVKIDLTTLPSGLYFISIVNENNAKISIQKIIKS